MHFRSLLPRVGLLAALLTLLLTLPACQPGETEPADAVAVSLLERWSDVRVVQPVPASQDFPPTVIDFGDDSEVKWSAVQGVSDLRVEDGALVGRSTSAAPLILLELPAPAGDGDSLWAVTTKLRASDGSRMSVHPVAGPGAELETVTARVEEMPISSPIVPGGEATSYLVELEDVLLLGMAPVLREPQWVLVRPTNVADAEFEIESLRLVFRQEHFASIDSGPGWHGLGEVYRETLISRAPETLVFDLDLPERPWLGLAVGSVEDEPPAFRVEVSVDGAEPETVAEIQPEAPETWTQERVDLSPWAGESVELRLSADGGPGSLAFWGAPTVRSSMDPAKGDRPQAVIVFLADTLRPDHLDAWGYDRETAPTIRRLASEGVRFEDTVAQSTWTKPSVASILTSLYPSSSGVIKVGDRVSAAETTLAEAYRQAGYATFATSSIPFTGQLSNLHQGVQVLHEFGAIPQTDGEFRSKTAEFWIDQFLPWLEMHHDVPVFAFIHVMDPHWPYQPAEPYDTVWATEEEGARHGEQIEAVKPFIQHPLRRQHTAPTTGELQDAGLDPDVYVGHEKNWYDGSIRAMDDQVARLVQRLEELELADTTLLALVSDHGEEFLEHGRHSHGTTVYGELSRVPMMIWGRGIPAGVVVEETVEAIDLYPTLVDLSGLEPPSRSQGQSLRPLFTDGATAGRSQPAFTELPVGLLPPSFERFAMVDGDWKLIWNRQPPEDIPEYELYDHRQDPLNLNDVASEHPDVVEQLSGQLHRWREWASAQKVDEEAVESEMSAEELEQLRSLGYVD